MKRRLELALVLVLSVTAFVGRAQNSDLARGATEDLAACMAGPDLPTSPECLDPFDADGDLDVDLHDVAALQLEYLPTGACCFEDLSCQILTEADCSAASGDAVWQGGDSECGQCVVVRVTSVTFGGAGAYTIKHDCEIPPCPAYATPQWLDANYDGDAADAGDHDFPVAYVRNSHVTLSGAQFHVEPPGVVSGVLVSGTGPDGLVFVGAGNLSGSTLTVSGSLISAATLPNTIRYYPTFDIDWEVAFDGVHFQDAGRSSTRLYVTRAATLGDGLESYFDISTRAADGLSDEQGMIDAVWNEFRDRVVCNVRGERLAYYRGVLCAADCIYVAASQLVYYRTSQCGGWADLLMQCLRTQGLGTSEFVAIYTAGYPTLPLDCREHPSPPVGFLVKNYGFGALDTACPSYPYSFNNPCGGHTPWPNPACVDQPGLPGQDNPNPASFFGAHFIVKLNGAYYDPSYGNGPFTGTKDQANRAWERASIAGYVGVTQSSQPGARKDDPQTMETLFDR